MAQLSAHRGHADELRGLLIHLILPPLGVATLFIGWYAVASAGVISHQFLPTPLVVLDKIIDLTRVPYSGALLQTHLFSSLEKFGVGYLLAACLGVPLGLLLGRFQVLEWALSPLLEAARFIPPIAWVPFSILWIGTGFLSPVLVIFSGVFFTCVVNSYIGAKLADKALLEAAQTLGVGRWLGLTEVLLPAALAHIVAGLRIGAGFGWQSLIGAELIVGSTGLGYMIVQGESNLNAPVVIAGMVTIGVVGALIDYVMRRIEYRIYRKWRR
ncbi:MAG: ABC transporter permease [Candidimonas sp.]|nr:MAG: ABC transporter permease [Candidimonas sp.]